MTNSPFSASDAFAHQERGVVHKICSAFFRCVRFTVASFFQLIVTLLCLGLFLLAFSVCLYTGAYLWTHHSANYDASTRRSVDTAGLRTTLREYLFGQSPAGEMVVDALESLVESNEDHRRLVSIHGSTGVGKSHIVNLLKSHLPSGSVHILYPDLVVHDLINHDESASEARSAHFLKWLTNRLTRGKDAPLQIIVVENSDAHLDLIPEIAVAIKSAVTAHDAELLKSMDMRKENGLTDALDNWIDNIFDVPKIIDSSDLLSRNKLLFVFVSNAGFRYINAMAYKDVVESQSKNSEGNSEFEILDSISSVIEEKEASFVSSIGLTGMKPRVIPLLPLRRDALRRCLLANQEFVDSSAAGSRVDDVVEKVLEKAEYFPKNNPTFSVSGCKRISSWLMN